jgi:poly(A) polymerase
MMLKTKTRSKPLVIAGNSVNVKPTVYDRRQHNIQHRFIDIDALKIIHRLQRSGFKAYVVGGGVRDLLLGVKPKDFDIGTDASPEEIRSLFRNSRIIGRRFRLVHIFFRDQKNIEVATFRSAGEVIQDEESGETIGTDENVYGSEATDAFRRDLTINALFYDPSEFAIIDYVGGVKDLRSKIIRIIGEPDLRFQEDPIRLLRTVRHAARIDFNIEDETLASLKKNLDLLKGAPQVRVYEELRKDLHSGRSLKIIKAFAREGLLDLLIPELNRTSELLSESSDLAYCLAKIDALVQDRHEVSTTLILAVIALFIGSSQIKRFELQDRFKSISELLEHVDNCFTDLAVPRKERERIELLLTDWLKLASGQIKNTKLATLRNRPHFDDLKTLLRLTSMSEDTDILTLIDESEHGRTERGAQRSGGRKRQNTPRSPMMPKQPEPELDRD